MAVLEVPRRVGCLNWALILAVHAVHWNVDGDFCKTVDLLSPLAAKGISQSDESGCAAARDGCGENCRTFADIQVWRRLTDNEVGDHLALMV